MVLFTNFGGAIYKGAVTRQEELDDKRVSNAEKLAAFAKSNPYATNEQLQDYADNLSGSKNYLRAPSIGEGSVGAFGKENARNRQERNVSDRLSNANAWQKVLEINPNATPEELQQLSEEMFNGEDHGFNSDRSIEDIYKKRMRDKQREQLRASMEDDQMTTQLEESLNNKLYSAWENGADLPTAMANMTKQMGQDPDSPLGEMAKSFFGRQTPAALDAKFASDLIASPRWKNTIDMALDAAPDMTVDDLVSRGGLPAAVGNSPYLRQLLQNKIEKAKEAAGDRARQRQTLARAESAQVSQTIRALGSQLYLTSDEINGDPDVIYARKSLGYTDEMIDDLLRQGALGSSDSQRTGAMQAAQETAYERMTSEAKAFRDNYELLGDDASVAQRQAIGRLEGYYIPRSKWVIVDQVMAQTSGKKNITAEDIVGMITSQLGGDLQTIEQASRSSAGSIFTSSNGFTQGPMYSDKFMEQVVGDGSDPGYINTTVRGLEGVVSRIASMQVAREGDNLAVQRQIGEVLPQLKGFRQELMNLQSQMENPKNFIPRVGEDAQLSNQRRLSTVGPLIDQSLSRIGQLERSLEMKLTVTADDISETDAGVSDLFSRQKIVKDQRFQIRGALRQSGGTPTGEDIEEYLDREYPVPAK